MIRTAWLLLAALPLAGQPKELVNSQVDTRSAAAGLETPFRALLAAQPQPAWIGYSIPVAAAYNLNCEYTTPGVIHLEPPDHANVLFRIVNGAVERIRVLSPDCQIDARGVPVHWLVDVRPADNVTLLASFVQAAASQTDSRRATAVRALAISTDPSALDVLIAVARNNSDTRLRRQAMNAIGRSRDPRAQSFLAEVLRR